MIVAIVMYSRCQTQMHYHVTDKGYVTYIFTFQLVIEDIEVL